MRNTMEFPKIDRRKLCTGLLGATGMAFKSSNAMAFPDHSPAAPMEGKNAKADINSTFQRFMKIYASTANQTVWYWYSGTLELAPQDGPVVQLSNIETLIRRDVIAKADGSFSIRTSEANYLCSLGDRKPADSLVNPVTGRTIAPMHFSEGPRDTPWKAASLEPRKAGGLESTISLSQAGDYIWLKREMHADFPHPLDQMRWPLEASGSRNRTGSFSTHCALVRDVENPALACAPCSFTYSAVFGWFPWLLMGQRPGHMLWHAHGMKIADLRDLPKDARAGFQQTFPAIFDGKDFGPEGVDLWRRFEATHKPATL